MGASITAVLFPLLFAPGAWVFCTNHTEAIFLILSYAAFAAAWRGQYRGGIYAGLCALTRNQGILVAICCALMAAQRTSGTPKKIGTLLAYGSTSLSLYALWPLYQYLQTGDALASSHAQSAWHVAGSMGEYLGNLVWISGSTVLRKILFWGILGLSAERLWRQPEERPLWLYCTLSVLLWPLQQYNLPQAYRFSAVLFPVWFFLGRQLWSVQRHKYLATSAFLVGAALMSSRYFGQWGWPY